MFTRTHRIGKYDYTEVLESYRDAGGPKHRCIARWRAGRSLAEELGRTRFDVEAAARSAAYWQGVLERTVKPRRLEHIRRAPDAAAYWQRRLARAGTQLAALTNARKAIPADDADIDRAAAASRQRRDRTLGAAPPALLLIALADRVRGLMVQNDPDAVRAGLGEIAAALDALASN